MTNLVATLQRVNEDLKRGRHEIAIYNPSAWQRDFLGSNDRLRAIIACNRAGKTLTGAVEAVLNMLGQSSFGRSRKHAPTTGLIVCRTWATYKDVIAPMIWHLLPSGQTSKINFNINTGLGARFELDNGSVVYVRSDENPDNIAGIQADWAWIDEAPKRHTMLEVEQRIAVGLGSLWLTCTPDRPKLEWLRDKVESSDWHRWHITLDQLNMPWRTQTEIDAQMKSLSPAEKHQRAYANWDVIVDDRFMTNYDPVVHVRHLTEQEDNELVNVHVSFDWGMSANKDAWSITFWTHCRVNGQYMPRAHVTVAKIEPNQPTTQEIVNNVKTTLLKLKVPIRHCTFSGDVNLLGKDSGSTKINDEASMYLGAKVESAMKGNVNKGLHNINMLLRQNLMTIEPGAQTADLQRCLSVYRDQKDEDDILDSVRYAINYIDNKVKRPRHSPIVVK